MMRAPAVRIMKSRPRAEAASSNLLALHRTDQKTCPNATRNACAFRSHSPANFEFPRRAGDPARARITSISVTPATQRSRVGGNGVFFIKASPSSGGPKPRPQKLPDLMAAANAADPKTGRKTEAERPAVCEARAGREAREPARSRAKAREAARSRAKRATRAKRAKRAKRARSRGKSAREAARKARERCTQGARSACEARARRVRA